MLSILLMSLSLQTISQSKPPASGRVTVLAEDLKLVIKSNEEGKKAKAQIQEYASRVNILQANIIVLNSRIALKDSVISDQGKSIDNLLLVSYNKDVIISAKDKEIQAGQVALKQAERDKKKAKRKTFFTGLLGALTTASVIFLKF